MSKAESSAKVVATRKRNRKRKRRVASSESSSSSSGSGSDSSSDGEVVHTITRPTVAAAASSSSSSSSSSSDSDSDGPVRRARPTERTAQRQVLPMADQPRRRSPSISPPPAPIPSFLPPTTTDSAETQQNEQLLKDRFRKFWMSSVADGFKDDLEQIRKEPGLTTSRLAMLIDSLASGADVFPSVTSSGSNGVNEMEVVLDS